MTHDHDPYIALVTVANTSKLSPTPDDALDRWKCHEAGRGSDKAGKSFWSKSKIDWFFFKTSLVTLDPTTFHAKSCIAE